MKNRTTKLIIILSIVLSAFMMTSAFFSHSVSAINGQDCSKVPDTERQACLENPNNYDSNQVNATFEGGACNRGGFFGLVTWDCNVKIYNEESLKRGIWQIVANIATDITIIAAYLVLGYVIYGGYLYMFSAGDPGKLASSKKTLAHAFIGLAIAMSAYVIINFIRIVFLGEGVFNNCALDQCANPNELASFTFQWAVGVAGVVAAAFVLYGGILYTTSAGDPGKLEKAKKTILYALIGLAIVALAEIITAFVSNTIRDANSTGVNQIITPKEYHEKNIS